MTRLSTKWTYFENILFLAVFELEQNKWNRNWMEAFESAGFMFYIVTRVHIWRHISNCFNYQLLFQVMTSYDLWKFLLVTIISLVLNQTWISVYMMVICAHPGIAHRICPMVSAIGGFAGGFLVPRPQMPVV